MQIEIIVGTDYRDLTNQVNAYLEKIKSKEDPKVDIDFKNVAAVVSYTESVGNNLCCECRYFDDGDSPDSLIGLCQEHGGRKRFNCKSCKEFKDIRG